MSKFLVKYHDRLVRSAFCQRRVWALAEKRSKDLFWSYDERLSGLFSVVAFWALLADATYSAVC